MCQGAERGVAHQGSYSAPRRMKQATSARLQQGRLTAAYGGTLARTTLPCSRLHNKYCFSFTSRDTIDTTHPALAQIKSKRLLLVAYNSIQDTHLGAAWQLSSTREGHHQPAQGPSYGPVCCCRETALPHHIHLLKLPAAGMQAEEAPEQAEVVAEVEQAQAMTEETPRRALRHTVNWWVESEAESVN